MRRDDDEHERLIEDRVTSQTLARRYVHCSHVKIDIFREENVAFKVDRDLPECQFGSDRSQEFAAKPHLAFFSGAPSSEST